MKSADYCTDYGDVIVCGTHIVEHSRRSDGIKWCFTCRKPHEFWWVTSAPDGFSYDEPEAHMEGTHTGFTALFPGWYREAINE